MKIIPAKRKGKRRKQQKTRKPGRRTNEGKRLIFQTPGFPPPPPHGQVVMDGAQISIYIFYTFSLIFKMDFSSRIFLNPRLNFVKF